MNNKKIFFLIAIGLFILSGCKSIPDVRSEGKVEGTEKQEHKTVQEEVRNNKYTEKDREKELKTERIGPKTTVKYIDHVERLIDSLSLSQKIGQRFIAYIPNNEINEKTKKLISEGNVAGFILYKRRNFESLEEFSKITETLQEISKKQRPSLDLFIAVDQEGGRVAAFRYPSMVQFPAAYHWGKYRDTTIARAVGYITGVEILEAGCNMNLAPVLDLYDKPDDSIIGDRSIGNNPAMVSRLGIAYIEGTQAAGVIPVAKHFPGHGVTRIDSHSSLPVVDLSLEQMVKKDLVPFKAAIDNGVEAIMTAHILYPKIDSTYPATLSPIFIDQILRKQLGFQGVVMTDAFSMGALTKEFNTETALKQCFKAGIDLILIDSRFDVLELRETVMTMVKKGDISEEEIDKGLRRVLSLKYKKNMIH